MPRFVKGRFGGAVLPPPYGGTGQTTLAGLKSALGLVDASQLGAANGFATLNTSKKLPPEQLAGKFAPIYVTGPTSLLQNATGTFVIKNYDDATDYVITPNAGTLTRVRDQITYTPTQSGARGFNINGTDIPVTVGVSGPIGVWGNADPNPAGATVASSSSPGAYRDLLFQSSGGRVVSCSITQPSDIPAGCVVRAEVNYTEGNTGVYVELQGTMPSDDYVGTCQLTVTTEAQPGDNNPSYPVGTQTQAVTVSVKRYYFSFSYTGVSLSMNNGGSYSKDIASRNLPNNEIVAPYQWPIEIISGSIPPGMSFQSGFQTVGVRLVGNPSSDGNYSFTIRLRPPAGWVVNPAGAANAYQDMSFSASVTTPIPDNENLLSTVSSYKLASGTKTFRVLKNNTGSVPSPYEWKKIGDGSMAAVAGWSSAGVAPGAGPGYLDVAQTTPAPPQPNVYTNLQFTYNNNSGAFFSSMGLYLEVLQAHYTMQNLGPNFSSLQRGQTTYRNLAADTGQVQTGSVQLLSGSLPPGMSLSAQGLVIVGGTGVVLIGTPTQAGTYNFTYRCSGGNASGYQFNEGPVDFTASVTVTEIFTIQTGVQVPNSSAQQFICAWSNTGNFTAGTANSLPNGCTFSPNVGGQDCRINVPAGLPPGTYGYTITMSTMSGTDTQSGAFQVTGPSEFNNLTPHFNSGAGQQTLPAISSNYGNISSFSNVSNLPQGASLSIINAGLYLTFAPGASNGAANVSLFLTVNYTGGATGSGWYTFSMSYSY